MRAPTFAQILGAAIVRRGSGASEVLVVRADLSARVEPRARVHQVLVEAGAGELAAGLEQLVVAPHEVLVLRGVQTVRAYEVSLDVVDPSARSDQ